MLINVLIRLPRGVFSLYKRILICFPGRIKVFLKEGIPAHSLRTIMKDISAVSNLENIPFSLTFGPKNYRHDTQTQDLEVPI